MRNSTATRPAADGPYAATPAFSPKQNNRDDYGVINSPARNHRGRSTARNTQQQQQQEREQRDASLTNSKRSRVSPGGSLHKFDPRAVYSSAPSPLSSASPRSATHAHNTVQRIHARGSSSATGKKKKKSFHVRITLGYVTGLKMEQKNKKKNVDNHSLVVGYAALSKFPNSMAVSQPIVPNVDDSKSKNQKIVWMGSNRKKGPTSKIRRRLQFCVNLDHEEDTIEGLDTESRELMNEYVPEVIQITIGLKCGDETYSLGTANLVISGNDLINQKVDMSVRPAAVIPKPKQRRGLFGRKHHKESDETKFANGSFSYDLSPNATLRVRLDVVEGGVGDHDPFFGIRGDDESYTTKFSLDGSFMNRSRTIDSFQNMPQLQQQSPQQLQQRRQSNQQQQQQNPQQTRQQIEVPVQRSFRAPERISTPALPAPFTNAAEAERLAFAKEEQKAGQLYAQAQQSANIQDFPIQALELRLDEMTLVSTLTKSMQVPNPFSCLALNICTGSDAPAQRQEASNTKNGSTDDVSWVEEGSSWDGESLSIQDKQGNRIHGNSPNQIRNKQTSTPEYRNEDIAAARAVALGNREHPVDDISAADLTHATITDLKDAQETLRRYADKVGVSMEELLEAAKERRAWEHGQARC